MNSDGIEKTKLSETRLQMIPDNTQITVVDAGARYGVHPSWKPVIDIVNFNLFEVEPIECARLTKKYSDMKNVQVSGIALGSKEMDLKFAFREHRGLTSTFSLSDEVLRDNYKPAEFQENSSFIAKVMPLDTLFPNMDVDFLKLDVEGAELEILNGAESLMATSILGVRSEVCFSQVYKDAPLFGDLDRKIRDFDFQLVNLDYNGRGAAKNEFTLDDRYGRLISTDAVWILPISKFTSHSDVETSQKILKQALFLTLNGATDLAIDVLDESLSLGLNLFQKSSTPTAIALKKRLALLFKSLLDKPQFTTKQITEKWSHLYQEEFPIMSGFWESDFYN
jgi:FkbM family methyltransferase